PPPRHHRRDSGRQLRDSSSVVHRSATVEPPVIGGIEAFGHGANGSQRRQFAFHFRSVRALSRTKSFPSTHAAPALSPAHLRRGSSTCCRHRSPRPSSCCPGTIPSSIRSA